MADYGATDRVRTSATAKYVEPARAKRAKRIEIHSGTFARALVTDGALAPNRYPIVCNALRSKRFLKENQLRIIQEKTKASSGQSSDVTFVYELDYGTAKAPASGAALSRFDELRGLLKEAYATAGGAAAAIEAERKAWGK